MDHLAQTLDLIKKHGWSAVLLRKLSKRPAGTEWEITRDLSRILEHLDQGGNLGLVCGEDSGVMVLDFDNLIFALLLEKELGELRTTVQTGSNKRHCYFPWEPDMPAKIYWGDAIVGEVQRGPRQQVVMPPSTHPDTKQAYRWMDVDFQPLPATWRKYLVAHPRPVSAVPERTVQRPLFVPPSTEGHPIDEWDGPDASELVRRALEQPGARQRRGGVKFQCPGCRNEGRDKSKDNATVFPDGKWGCAIDKRHSRAIGTALGFYFNPPVDAAQAAVEKKLRKGEQIETEDALQEVFEGNLPIVEEK